MDDVYAVLALLGRLLVAGLMLACGMAAALMAFRGRGGRDRSPGRQEGARARRPGPAQLAAAIARSRQSSQAREALDWDFRRLLRQAIACRQGIDEAAARKALDSGEWEGEPGILAFLAKGAGSDAEAPRRLGLFPRLARGRGPGRKRKRDYPEELDRAMGLLEIYAGKAEGKMARGGRE